jgi:hypothetical protein
MNMKLPMALAAACGLLAVANPAFAQSTNGTLTVKQLIDAVNAKGEDRSVSAKVAEFLHLGSEALPAKKIRIPVQGSEDREISAFSIENDAKYILLVHMTSTEGWMYAHDDKEIEGLGFLRHCHAPRKPV